MNPIEMAACPICRTGLLQAMPSPSAGSPYQVDCPNCGFHFVTHDAAQHMAEPRVRDEERARIAFGVCKVASEAIVDLALVRTLATTVSLPPASERIDNLVLSLARLVQPGERVRLSASDSRARIGAETPQAAKWVIEQALALGLIESLQQRPMTGGGGTFLDVTLTIEGWSRSADLLRQGTGSRHAFMAMQFGDEVLTSVFNEHMRDAVAQTGFELRTVNGAHQTAGSIDNRMRVEIRTSRFLICDLTHGNRGAYWEAGFAEGIGRPVFYTCREGVLRDRSHAAHPHFDINHQLIVPWNPEDPAPAMLALKDAIRATLPGEAKMEDD